MAVEIIHLRKLLQLLYASPRDQQTLLRAEIRAEIAKENGVSGGGGDFYGPFWADARDHVFEINDLHLATDDRIARNNRRARLYPILRDGFLKWWNEQRRWTNTPFESVRAPSGQLKFSEILTIKVDGIIAVKDATGTSRYIYPYFSETPALKNEGARISLWVFYRTFPGLDFNNFRILDVPRGRIYSPDRCYLEGDEAQILKQKYDNLWQMYVNLEEDYR
ncbi:hypothetical protein [Sphingobium sp. RAC03]|uniref:hypothetical protein n=1 Tax=Sphingobium sp. RAC03 TaxID=1843368 RepID=UPI0008574A3C|nr:hypothetical protein [Sphingobium sp. RAC03]AOF98278.1 hypothetical protein BSY17_446 [Sphingobium sp. RAC03]